MIKSQVKTANNDDEFSIIFFTDGEDTCGNDAKIVDDLKSNLNLQFQDKNISTRLCCIGFSKHHDAVMLNSIAKAGSNLGNFIYIDTNNPEYKEQMKEALSETLGMIINDSGNLKLKLNL